MTAESQTRKSVWTMALFFVGLVAVASALKAVGGPTWSLALDTLKLAAATVLIAVPAGTILATLLVRTDVLGRAAGGWLLVTLLFVPLYVQAASWNAGFGTLGWYTIASDSITQPLLSGFSAATWVHAMAAVPWTTLIIGIALRNIERELEEQALLSWSPLRVWWSVTLMRSWPAIVVATLWTIFLTTSEMVVTDIFRVRTYAEVLYSGFAMTSDAGAVTLRVLPGVIFIAGLSLAALLLAMTCTAQTPRHTYGQPFEYRLGISRLPATLLTWFLLCVIGGIPIFNLIYKAGATATITGDEAVRWWSPTKFTEVVTATPIKFGEEFGWSILIGIFAATLTVFVALPTAWLARDGGWRAWPTLILTAAFLAIPGPLVSLGLAHVFTAIPIEVTLSSNRYISLYDDTLIAPVLAAATRCLPLALMALWFTLRTVHRTTLEKAALDGYSRWTTFLRVVLPQRWRGIVVAWLASFAVAAGDLSSTWFVRPPGIETVPAQVFSLIHAGVRNEEAGICLYVIAAIMFVHVIVNLGQRVRSRA